jgi:hypothetical protein
MKPDKASDIKTTAASVWFGLTSGANSRMFLIAAFVIGAAVTLAHRPWRQIEIGDEAIWDYVAQSILRGQVPYRDVVEIKSPGSAYLSASAMLIGRLFGLRDVFAVRLLYVLMVGLLSAITFALGQVYFRDRIAALISFLVPLASWHFPEWMAAGTEPKLPLILFGLLSLLLLARQKPFWAGFCSMLSFFCWQPGLLFTGALVLVSSNYLTRWRDLRAVKVMLGTFVPLAILGLYFFWIGALGDLWAWTIAYNYAVYAPETARGFSDSLIHLWRVSLRVFKLDITFVFISAIGMGIFGIQCVRAKLKRAESAESADFRIALLIPPVVYLAFCLINFQSGPDLIPLFPFIGLFAGRAFVKLGDIRFGRGLLKPLPGLALAVIIVLVLFRAATYKLESGLTLQDQDRQFAEISKALAPGDSIYVHGAVEILVLLNRPNLNPYIFLDRRKDDWIAKRRPGGFQTVIDEMESREPKIVALSRLGKVAHREELEQWLRQHYDRVSLPSYQDVYIRRPSSY